jgi:glycosyltransferase involved in cell wall biosynthesis
MPTTVVHVIHDLRSGGTERRMLNLLAKLDRTRYRPLLCCIDDLGPLAEDARDLEVEPFVLGRKWRFDLRGIERLARVVRANRPAVVHSWLYIANVFGRIGGLLGHAEAMVAADGATEIPASPARQVVVRTIDRLLSLPTDCVIANSDAVASSLEARGIPREKITVIRNGVSVPPVLTEDERIAMRSELGASTDDHVVGMVARLTTVNKDHQTFLRAAAHIHRAERRVRFVLVGDGPARAELEALVHGLGLAETVRFAGHRGDASKLIGCFDVSVLCSLFEGFSNVILESMASGRPVVATDIGPNREAIDDGVHGLLVPIRHPEATAAAIVRLLENPEEARRLGANGRARAASEFSLELQAERTMDLYDRLLARKRR